MVDEDITSAFKDKVSFDVPKSLIEETAKDSVLFAKKETAESFALDRALAMKAVAAEEAERVEVQKSAKETASETKEQKLGSVPDWLMKNKSGAMIGLLGLIAGFIFGNPMMGFLALLGGFAAGNIMLDGKESALNSVFGRTHNETSAQSAQQVLQPVVAASQNQNQSQVNDMKSTSENRFLTGIQRAATPRDISEGLKHTLAVDFKDTKYIKGNSLIDGVVNLGKLPFRIFSGNIKDSALKEARVLKIGDHWIRDSGTKAEQLGALITNYYKDADFRHHSPQEAARLIASDPNIHDTLGVGSSAVVYSSSYDYSYGRAYITDPRGEINSRLMVHELQKYIVQNHADIASAVETKIVQQSAAKDLGTMPSPVTPTVTHSQSTGRTTP